MFGQHVQGCCDNVTATKDACGLWEMLEKIGSIFMQHVSNTQPLLLLLLNNPRVTCGPPTTDVLPSPVSSVGVISWVYHNATFNVSVNIFAVHAVLTRGRTDGISPMTRVSIFCMREEQYNLSKSKNTPAPGPT